MAISPESIRERELVLAIKYSRQSRFVVQDWGGLAGRLNLAACTVIVFENRTEPQFPELCAEHPVDALNLNCKKQKLV